MTMRSAPGLDEPGMVKTARELLDDARSAEATDVYAARAMAQQARVLARTLDDGAVLRGRGAY